MQADLTPIYATFPDLNLSPRACQCPGEKGGYVLLGRYDE